MDDGYYQMNHDYHQMDDDHYPGSITFLWYTWDSIKILGQEQDLGLSMFPNLAAVDIFRSCRLILFIWLPLYFGGEMWEGIWNQTHLVVLNFCLERLHHVTIYLTIRHAQTISVNYTNTVNVCKF